MVPFLKVFFFESEKAVPKVTRSTASLPLPGLSRTLLATGRGTPPPELKFSQSPLVIHSMLWFIDLHVLPLSLDDLSWCLSLWKIVSKT